MGHEAFEYSHEGFDSFKVTTNGITRTDFITKTTTVIGDHNVNTTTPVLSFFGPAAAASVNQIEIGMDSTPDG